MDFLLKRLVGAIAICSLAIIFIPAIFSGNNHTSFLAEAEYADPDTNPYKLTLKQHLSDAPIDEQALVHKVSHPVEDNSHAWSIRVGSFSDPSVASQLEEKLQQHGYTAYLQSSDNHLYHVLVGPEPVSSNAQVVLARLSQQLNLNGVIVPYEPVLYVQNMVQRG